jgi:hypothetical protein
MTEEEPETILTWLRAGMPHAVEGDWETGKGFGFRFAWVFDWKAMLVWPASLGTRRTRESCG